MPAELNQQIDSIRNATNARMMREPIARSLEILYSQATDYEIDEYPTEGSSNPVRSDGVVSFFNNLMNASSMSFPTGDTELIEKTVNESGTYDAIDDNVDGYYRVIVSAHDNLASITITEPGIYNANDDGLDGYSVVDVSIGTGRSELAIIDRSISEYIDENGLLSIGSYAFAGCWFLTSVSFPSCTIINDCAFYNCAGNLSSVSFENCTFIGHSAFQNCGKLTSIIFPECSSIYPNAFAGCGSINNISFPKCTYIGSSAFNACSSLTAALFPECTSIGETVFRNCSALTSVDFPKCSIIGSNAFLNCYSLVSVSFPMCEQIYSSAFLRCRSLSVAYFPKLSKIWNDVFSSCTSLVSLYLENSNVCELVTSLAFSGTTTSIYVPSSLYLDYIVANNWSNIWERIVPIDGTKVDEFIDAAGYLVLNSSLYGVNEDNYLVIPSSKASIINNYLEIE